MLSTAVLINMGIVISVLPQDSFLLYFLEEIYRYKLVLNTIFIENILLNIKSLILSSTIIVLTLSLVIIFFYVKKTYLLNY